MSRINETKIKHFRLTADEVSAIQELALAGHVLGPEKFSNRTEVGVIRKAIREAWNNCPQTKDKPFPGK